MILGTVFDEPFWKIRMLCFDLHWTLGGSGFGVHGVLGLRVENGELTGLQV